VRGLTAVQRRFLEWLATDDPGCLPMDDGEVLRRSLVRWHGVGEDGFDDVTISPMGRLILTAVQSLG
jgi:hypothetical protein